MATELQPYSGHSFFINSHSAVQSQYGRIPSGDKLFLEINTKFANIKFNIANDVQQILKLFHNNGDSVPRVLSKNGTQYIADLVPEELDDDPSKSLTSALANNGSNCSCGNSNWNSAASYTYTDKQIVRWASSYERHESIASGYLCSKQRQIKVPTIIKSPDGEKPDKAISKLKAASERVNKSISSRDNITDLYRVFSKTLNSILGDDSVLASRILRHAAPKLHLICPLFRGKSLLSPLEEDIANEGEQDAGSQPTSSSTPNDKVAYSLTSKTIGGSGKLVRKQRQDDDDNDNGKGSKRSKRNPISSSRQGHTWRRPRFKCPFYARCSINNCRKNESGRTSTSSGYDSYHHIQDHLKEYHTVIRCQRCHTVFKEEAAMLRKNEHQIRCEARPLIQIHDVLVIDCDMKVKLKDKMKRFKKWSLESNHAGDQDMKSWISNCIGILTGITKPRAELNEEELQRVISDERELAKWYTCWVTLFPTLPIPHHPFHEHDIPSVILDRLRVESLFEAVGAAVTEQTDLPAGIRDVTLQLLQRCVSISLDMLMLPNNANNLDPNLMARITLLHRDMLAPILRMRAVPHRSTRPVLALPDMAPLTTSTTQSIPFGAIAESPFQMEPSPPPSQDNEHPELQADPAPLCHHCRGFGLILSQPYASNGSPQGQGTLQPCICRSTNALA